MNPQDILMYGHRTVLRTLEYFPKTEWYTPGACGYWSVKDLVAHLASFELVLVEILDNLLDPGATPLVDQFSRNGQAFNDEQVDRLRKDRKMEEVLAEYQRAHERVRLAASQISPVAWDMEGSLPWYGKEYDLEDFIVYSFYGHKREHCGQIQVFSDKFRS